MGKLIIIILSLSIASCALVPREELNAPERLELNKIKDTDKDDGHEKRLLEFTKKYPDSYHAQEVYFELGNIAFNKKDFLMADKHYSQVKKRKLYDKARVLRAHALLKLNKTQEAYSIVAELVTNNRLDKNIMYYAISIKAMLAEKIETTNERLLTYDRLLTAAKDIKPKYDDYPSTTNDWDFTSDPLKYRIKAIQIIDSLEINSLIDIDLSYKLLKAHLFFRLGNFYFEQSEFDRARIYLNRAMRLDNGEYREKSSHLISKILAKGKVNRKTIGVVLPISGEQNAYGHMALLGLNAAFGTYDSNNNSDYKIVVMDSKNNESVAGRAVETLVLDHHAVAVIGGLLSKTADIISTKAQELEVVNITLSQKDGITDIGDYIFRSAMTLSDQIDFLVRTAINKHNIKNFGMLYPKTKYGEDSSLIFLQTVLKNGGNLLAAQSYEHSETDFSEHVKKLIGTYYIKDRMTEYKTKLDEWKTNNPHMSARTQPPADLLEPIISFDALFIPDDVKALGQIAPMLTYNDVDDVVLLGTNLWNTPSLKSRVAGDTRLIYVDSFTSETPSFSTSKFRKDFLSTFNKEPTIIELQAYDAGVFLKAALDKLRVNSRKKLRDIMLDLDEIPGALGFLKVQKDTGAIERPLVVLNHGQEETTEE